MILVGTDTREERLARRIADLHATDQQFAAARPSEAVSAAIDQPGVRNAVPIYLQNLGWRSVGTPISRLLADNGLAATPHSSHWVPMANTVYYTSVLSK